ncbi:methylaspartate mutase [Streptomyces atriruber]|uniref:methylaspartate mutase n=1 Tax=Streptomyces atriruber TaxID=545121 RepID=UPI0006E25D0D|nr:methylaspartate mutase [Streptomyces atriruber]
MPRTSGFGAYVAGAGARDELVVQSRMGFASPEAMRAGLDAVRDAGPRVVGTITLDSFTRTGQFLRAGRAIASGESLNGYPLVSHSAANNSLLLRGMDLDAFPVQVRHGSPEPQEIFRTMLRYGLTVSEGGPVSYCLPYSRVPLRRSIDAWAEGCRILADGAQDAAHLETFGGCMLGQLCPPGLLVALSVLECLFFAEHGIRSVSLSYAQQTNPQQDRDAILALRALAGKHLGDLDWHVVLYTFMGVYPKSTEGATALLRESAALAASSGCERLIVKTTVESQRIPTIAENVAALRIAAAAAYGVPRSAHRERSEVLREASALIDATLSLKATVGDSLHEAFRRGILDVPYCLHQDNRNRTRTSIDDDGSLRWASRGDMPLPVQSAPEQPAGAADRLLQMLSYNQHRFDAR